MGPFLVEFTLQSQSRSKKKKSQHSIRRQAEMLPHQSNAATTGFPRNHYQTINCAPGSPHIFQRVLLTVLLFRPGRTSHCSNNNKLPNIHSLISAKARSYLPFKNGWNNLFQRLPSQLLMQNIKEAYQIWFE